MAEVIPICGVILSGPSQPGAASGMRYVIEANLPSGVVVLQDQRPHIERHPDSIDVRPVKVGTGVGGYMVNGEIQWNFRELEDWQPCPGDQQVPAGFRIDPITGELIPDVPVSGGSTTLTPGGLPPPDGGIS